MNRRTFLAALAALPVVGKVFAGPEVVSAADRFTLTPPWPIPEYPRNDWPLPPNVILVRASRQLQKGDIVTIVGESQGYPLVAPASSPQTPVGFTTCRVDAWNWTVIKTEGEVIR